MYSSFQFYELKEALADFLDGVTEAQIETCVSSGIAEDLHGLIRGLNGHKVIWRMPNFHRLAAESLEIFKLISISLDKGQHVGLLH